MKNLSFFEILSGSLSYFTNPWIFLCLGGLLVFYFLYGLGIRKITDMSLPQTPSEAPPGGPGCLTQFLGVFTQSFVVALFLLLLLPIFMGVSTQISWQAVEPLGFVAIRAGLLAMIWVTLLTFMPWIGARLAASPGLEFFTLATLAYRYMIPLYLEAYLGREIKIGEVYPSYLQLVLYFITTFLLTGLLRWVMGKLSRSQILLWSMDLLVGITVFFFIVYEVAERARSLLPAGLQ